MQAESGQICATATGLLCIVEATCFQNVKALSLPIALRAKTPIIFQIFMKIISMTRENTCDRKGSGFDGVANALKAA
jgi:hypothetical protein